MRNLERSIFGGSALALAAATAPLAACGDDSDKTSVPANASAAIATYAEIASAAYDDSVAAADALEAAVGALLDTPSQATLDAARTAWLAAREPYLQTEVFRFQDGPIDGPPDNLEGRINAWPMDENYIDYVTDDANAGIVNGDGTIDATTLITANAAGGDENISTGFHAVEFLLWGQDLSADGPGDRPFSDFVVGGAGTNVERRRTYLEVVTKLLADDLATVADEWKPDQDNYRKELLAAAPAEGLRRILTGMIVLSGFETGGERLQAALDSGSQEDEHSCFSDNTHRDMIQDIQGIENVFHGRYTRTAGQAVDGTGIEDVVAAVDEALAEDLDEKIDGSLDLANDLHIPFDKEIALDNPDGRARVTALVVSLHDTESVLSKVFRKFGLTVPNPE